MSIQTPAKSPQYSPKKRREGQLIAELRINPEHHKIKTDRKSQQKSQLRLQQHRPPALTIPRNVRVIQSHIKIDNKHQHVNNASALDDLLEQSQKLVRSKKQVYSIIKNDKEKVEKRVYGAETSTRQEYLSDIYDQAIHQNEFVANALDEVVEDAHRGVEQQIVNNKYHVHRKISTNKDDLPALQKIDKYRLLKIKEGEVKNKVGDLRSQLQQQYHRNKHKRKFTTVDVLQHQYYGQQHPKTKQVESFIRKLHAQKNQIRQQHKEKILAKQQQQMRRRDEEQYYKEKARQERHQKIKEKYQMKIIKNMEESKIRKHRERQFKAWEKYYSEAKPLYQRKQEEFIESEVISQQQHIRQQILRRKAMNHPIDVQQIQRHQEDYIQYLRDDRIRKKAEMQIKQQEQEIKQQQTDRFYKGKFRYQVLQQMLEKRHEEDPRDIQRDKKARQIAFSEDLRQKNRLRNQTIKQLSARQNRDQKKSMVTRVRNAQGSMVLSHQNQNKSKTIDQKDISTQKHYDSYQQGIKNLKMVKQMIRDHVSKGQVKPHIRLLEEKDNIRPNYLQQIRERRQKHGSLSQTIQHQLDVTTNHQSIAARVQSLDEKVRQKELQKRHNSLKGQQQAQLQEGYLASIKAKLKLLTNFN